MIADSDARMLVCEREGRLAGTITVTRTGPRRAYLGMLAVDPALQAGGVGKALIADAEHEARDGLGALAIEMTVIERRPELIAWYERLGYRRTGELRPFPKPQPRPVDFAMVVLERSLV